MRRCLARTSLVTFASVICAVSLPAQSVTQFITNTQRVFATPRSVDKNKPRSLDRTLLMEANVGALDANDPSADDILILSFAKQLLDGFVADASSVYGATLVGLGALKVEEATNVWSDETIRGGYDKLHGITDILGSVAFALSTASAAKGETKQSQAQAWTGAGLMAILPLLNLGEIIKRNVGQESYDKSVGTAKKSVTALQQVDLSRRAFDDLKIQGELYEKYRTSAGDRLNDLKPLNQEALDLFNRLYTKKPVDASEINAFIDKLINSTNNYQLLSKFFGDFSDQLLKRVEYYEDTYSELKPKLQTAKTEVAKVSSDFDEHVRKPFLDHVPELQATLILWRAKHVNP